MKLTSQKKLGYFEIIFEFLRLGLSVGAQPAFESRLNNAKVKIDPHEMRELAWWTTFVLMWISHIIVFQASPTHEALLLATLVSKSTCHLYLPSIKV